jgi:acetyl esterase/lipase
MKIFLCLGFIIWCAYCAAQTQDLLLKRADSLLNKKEYRNAAVAYSAAAKATPEDKPDVLFRMLLLSARTWMISNAADSAFKELGKMTLIKNINYNSLTALTANEHLRILHNDSRWPVITNKLFENATAETFKQNDETYTQEEIIYGRKFGMALTMLKLKPKTKPNGKSIIHIRSGGWGSSFYLPGKQEIIPFLQNGFTVFVVFHGSGPIYNITDVIEDLQRAVRFIRYNANSFGLNPDKIGAFGKSAAGHLALMCGLSDSTSANTRISPDPVDRVSSKVKAVVSFSPSIDFLNWDYKDGTAYEANLFKHFLGHALQFKKWDISGQRFTYVTDSAELRKILKEISPVYHVSSNDAAVMIFHGDEDDLVPIIQAEILVQKLEDAKVPVSFIIKKGEGHGWPNTDMDTKQALYWFEIYLN